MLSSNFKAEEVHVQGLRDIAKACAESNVSRLIHISPALASKESKSLMMRSRAAGEDLLRKKFPESIIVRSSTLFGHEDRFLRAIGGNFAVLIHRHFWIICFCSFLLIAFSFLPFGYPVVNHGAAKRSPLYVGDLADGISRIIRLNDELVKGKTFDLFGYYDYLLFNA